MSKNDENQEMGERNGREIWIGESRVYLGKDNVIYATPVGDIDNEKAIAFRDNIIKLACMVNGKVNSLVNLNNVGKPSMGARAIGKEALMHRKIGKIAFYGLHPVAKILAAFVMGVKKNKNMRFFKAKEEALAWLKE